MQPIQQLSGTVSHLALRTLEPRADKGQGPTAAQEAILKQAGNKGGLGKASWRRGRLSARTEWQAPRVKTFESPNLPYLTVLRLAEMSARVQHGADARS